MAILELAFLHTAWATNDTSEIWIGGIVIFGAILLLVLELRVRLCDIDLVLRRNLLAVALSRGLYMYY